MLPYADLPYFIVILIIALPAALLGALGRPRASWILAATAIMAVVHFGPRTSGRWSGKLTELGVVIAYGAFQLLLVTAFARWRQRHRSGLVLALVVLASVAPLVVSKLVGFFRPNAGGGFLGISYVTFRAVDALIVVADQLERGVRPGTYLSFLFFPPTVSAGPIDRYRRFAADYEGTTDRTVFLEGLDHGIGALFRGLLYKFVLAALIEGELLSRFDRTPGPIATLGYMYCYSGFLFFDFAGYSSIAIGISRLFGIRTPENFNRPFLATNIAEFWNRWHISLSSWFRDHIYMRFVMAAAKARWLGGNRLLISSLGLLLTFGLMGAWHGLEPRYLLYGAYHATLLIGHQALSRRVRRRWPDAVKSKAWHRLSIAATFNAVCFGFLVFSGRLG